MPDIGFVTNPVTPFKAPVKPAVKPYFRYPYAGNL